ncbi:thioredoxin family protein [Cryptosporidium serpentis]
MHIKVLILNLLSIILFILCIVANSEDSNIINYPIKASTKDLNPGVKLNAKNFSTDNINYISSTLNKRGILYNITGEEHLNKLVKDHEFVLTGFIVPWCGMSRKAINQLQEVIYKLSEYKISETNIHIEPIVGLVDISKYAGLSEKMNISDYPDIKLISLGKNDTYRIYDYNGPINSERIFTWMHKKITYLKSHFIVKLNSINDITQLLSLHPLSCIYIPPKVKSEKEFITFRNVAKITDDVIFAQVATSENEIIESRNNNNLNVTLLTVSREDIFKQLNIKSKADSSVFILFKPFENRQSILNGPIINEKELIDFIDDEKLPYTLLLTSRTVGEIFSGKRAVLIGFFRGHTGSLDDKPLQYQPSSIPSKIQDIFLDTAKRLGKSILFVISGNERPIERRVMDYFHISDNELPIIKYIEDLNISPPKIYQLNIKTTPVHVNYKIDHSSSVEDEDNTELVIYDDTLIHLSSSILTNFIRNIQIGNIHHSSLSQKVPVEQSSPVYIVVGKTFESIVHDSNKDVLVLFYTPWCGHCKAFDPIYTEIANIVSSKHHIRISKIDMSANDVPDHLIGEPIVGFPSIRLYTKKRKHKPLIYDGEREVSALLDFIWIHTARDEL